MLAYGTRVIIRDDINKYNGYPSIRGKNAIIKDAYYHNPCEVEYALKVDGVTNPNSNYGYFYLPESCIYLENETIYLEKETIMSNINKYKGSFRVATISFLDNSSYEVNYRLYDDGFNYKEGDIVVAKSARHGLGIAKIKCIFDTNEELVCKENREIICPIDMTKYNEREEKAKEIAKLKEDMDKKAKELQGIALYEMMAEKSPELKEMLEKYKNLVNLCG